MEIEACEKLKLDTMFSKFSNCVSLTKKQPVINILVKFIQITSKAFEPNFFFTK